MNINVAELLNGNYILLLFVVLALGLCLGKLRLGSIQLGNSIGVLVVSLLLGQQHFSINTDALNLGFMLFIFCVGVEAGPNFFSIFFRDGKNYLMLALVMVGSALVIALGLGKLFGWDIGLTAGIIGYNFLHHAADDSFPSDHGTVIFTFALAFLCWHRLWSGSLLMVLAVVIAWSRVYLGVHWPLDMLGGLLAGMIGCLSAQIIWQAMGHKLYQRLQSWYRFCFALPIRKGWVRD